MFYDDDDDDEIPSSQYKSNRRGVFAQCMVAGAVLMLTTGIGMPIGYSAVLLPQLAEINGTLKIDEGMGSWIASIHSLATPIGSLFAGPILDTIGRRGCLQLTAVILGIGWLIIGLSPNALWILVGRFAAGFSVGMCGVAGQVLVGEIADAGTRGFFLTTSMAAYTGGVLLVYALGSAFTWQMVAFSAIVLPCISLIALSLITESPAWLVHCGKIIAAKNALMWLRGNDIKQASVSLYLPVNVEMSLLEIRAKEDRTRMSLRMNLRERTLEIRARVLHPGVLKPLLIITIFLVLQVLSGTYLIIYYGVDLVRDIGDGKINNYLAAVMTALTRFIFCFFACFLLLRIGRRRIVIISAIGTAVFSLILSGYMFSRVGEYYLDKYVIGICVFGYVGLNTIGLLTIPGMMIGELLPHRARGIGGGCTMFIFNLTLFSVTKFFPMVKSMIGMSGVFMIFGLSAVIMTIFTWLIFPETKNQTLQEIEDYFNEGNVLWIKRRKSQKQRLTTPTDA
ncbi:hypothetical protein PV328_008160 [Microctonus aethiopoides]|uniref:Major facilitator superfamily (MFS) profile domain-containing protein n=1 Tax=Microctonus aethiopoides TaxID=144406 RepID=A0AA39CA91_9HYME|nr:hypothetical protein PV328_008160 [Microctonus aethiopoides]